MTVVTPEKCSINGYHRHRKNLLTKGNMVLFCTTFQLFFFLSWIRLFFFFPVKQVINLKQTSFDVWLLVCLHVDILFCYFPNRRGDRNQTFKGNALFECCFTSSGPPTVTMLHSRNVSTHSDNAASSDINIYVLQLRSTKRHTVAWEISAGCC